MNFKRINMVLLVATLPIIFFGEKLQANTSKVSDLLNNAKDYVREQIDQSKIRREQAHDVWRDYLSASRRGDTKETKEMEAKYPDILKVTEAGVPKFSANGLKLNLASAEFVEKYIRGIAERLGAKITIKQTGSLDIHVNGGVIPIYSSIEEIIPGTTTVVRLFERGSVAKAATALRNFVRSSASQ